MVKLSYYLRAHILTTVMFRLFKVSYPSKICFFNSMLNFDFLKTCFFLVAAILNVLVKLCYDDDSDTIVDWEWHPTTCFAPVVMSYCDVPCVIL